MAETRTCLLLAVLLLAGCAADVDVRRSSFPMKVVTRLEEHGPGYRNERGVRVVREETVGRGTGFAISRTRIVTAAHLCKREGVVSVKRVYAAGRELVVTGMGPFGMDGFFLDVESIPEGVSILTVEEVPRRKTAVVVPGYPRDAAPAEFHVAEGEILSPVATSALIRSGMSGAPVIDRDTGCVCGVACAMIPQLGVSEITDLSELPED